MKSERKIMHVRNIERGGDIINLRERERSGGLNCSIHF